MLNKSGFYPSKDIVYKTLNFLIEPIITNIFSSLICLKGTNYFPKCIVFGGGFTANLVLRSLVKEHLLPFHLKIIFPEFKYSKDNSHMIFKTALFDIKYKERMNINKKTKPSWPLNEIKCDE